MEDQNVRYMQLEDCQDEMHDICPEMRDGILSSRVYICDCTCHE